MSKEREDSDSVPFFGFPNNRSNSASASNIENSSPSPNVMEEFLRNMNTLMGRLNTSSLVESNKQPFCVMPDLSKSIQKIQWGINNTYHSTIKTTPFRLLFAYTPRDGGPFDDISSGDDCRTNAAEERRKAIENIKRSQEKQRIRYNVGLVLW